MSMTYAPQTKRFGHQPESPICRAWNLDGTGVGSLQRLEHSA